MMNRDGRFEQALNTVADSLRGISMNERMQPRSGDIVVSQQQRGPMIVYILRPVTGPDQILVRSREVALGQAMSIAARQNVRVWLTSDGRSHVPVENVPHA
jgi:hypothetical protein